MARLDEVKRLRAGIDRHLDRVGAIVRGDSGGHAFPRLHGDREGGLEGGLVLGRHQVEAELVAALRREREADETVTLARHEVDVLRRRELRGKGQIALVLAILRVADDDHLAGADVLDRLLDGRKWPVLTTGHVTPAFPRILRSRRPQG